jgi:hypothetical protein
MRFLLDLEFECPGRLLFVVQEKFHPVLAYRPGTVVGQIELELAASAGGADFRP